MVIRLVLLLGNLVILLFPLLFGLGLKYIGLGGVTTILALTIIARAFMFCSSEGFYSVMPACAKRDIKMAKPDSSKQGASSTLSHNRFNSLLLEYQILSLSTLSIVILISWILDSTKALLLVPALISVSLLFSFSKSLRFPPTMIERFALAMKKEPLPFEAQAYCRKVTIAWILFFIFNATVATYTAFFCSIQTWTYYNGIISYLLVGLIFALEFLYRIRVKRRIMSGLKLFLLISSVLVFLHPVHADEKPLGALDKIFLSTPIEIRGLDDITKIISKAHCEKRNFVQERHLTILSKPIVQTGIFSCIEGEQVIWNFLEPIVQTISITPKSISANDEFGGTMEISANIHPSLKSFTRIFLALFSSNLNPLDQYFYVYLERTGVQWRIGLASKNKGFDQFARAIVVEGKNDVRGVTIYEGSGDYTVVRFIDE